MDYADAPNGQSDGLVVFSGIDLVDYADKESIILLLPQPCDAYEGLSDDFPLNKTFYDCTIHNFFSLNFFSLNNESSLDGLLASLNVTAGKDGSITQKDGYTFWKAQGKVKKEKWLNHDYTPVLKIEKLKEKLRIRKTAWEKKEEKKMEEISNSSSNSSKRPRPHVPGTRTESRVDSDTSSSFPSKLKAIRACQTINEFIDMYDCGIVYDCLQRLRTSFSYYDPNLTLKERAECWATKLRNPHDAEAQAMDQDRKCCLELLYTMCNRWDPKDGEEKTVSDDDIINGFQKKRILGILLPYCLPMDRAKSLYFMVSAMTGQNGIHWFAKHHKEDIDEDVLIGYEPSINKRYFKLLGLKELELDKLPILTDLLQYTLLEEIQ